MESIITKFFYKIFRNVSNRMHVTLEIHQGKKIFYSYRWFNFISQKKLSDTFTAADLNIPSSCLFLYKKNGYIITHSYLSRDSQGGYASISCKIIAPEDSHTTLARDLRILRTHGWTSKE